MSGLPALHAYRLVVRGREEEQRQARTPAFGQPLAKACRVEALGRMKNAVPSQIELLFERLPALCGFSVLGLGDVPDSCPRGDACESGLFVGDVGVSPEPSQEQLGEIFQEIAAAVADVLAEAPGAEDYLRGRTFARVLH